MEADGWGKCEVDYMPSKGQVLACDSLEKPRKKIEHAQNDSDSADGFTRIPSSQVPSFAGQVASIEG